MKKIVVYIFIFFSIKSFGQVVPLKGDTIKIYKTGGSAELILQNATRSTKGFLYNNGNGVTSFRKGLITINDSTHIIGSDTLFTHTGSGGAIVYTGGNGLNLNVNTFQLGGALTQNTSLDANGNQLYFNSTIPANYAFNRILGVNTGSWSAMSLLSSSTVSNTFADGFGPFFQFNARGIDNKVRAFSGIDGVRDGNDSSGRLRFYNFVDGNLGTIVQEIGRSGQVKFNNYTGSNFYGTLAHRLGVDASGNVIQDTTTLSGGGSGNYDSAFVKIQSVAGDSTKAAWVRHNRSIPADTLSIKGGISGGGSGSVTSFGKVDNYGITSSVSNPTTTPVLTIGVDTNAISTKIWRQKGIDSLVRIIDSSFVGIRSVTGDSTKAQWVRHNRSIAADTFGIMGGSSSSSLSLTTTGSSGPATLVSNVLNIPQYSSGGGSFYDSTLMASTKRLKDSLVAVRSSIPVNNNTLINGSGYITSATFYDSTLMSSTKRLKDTAAAIRSAIPDISGKVNISDTSAMLNPYLRKIDSTLANRITANTASLNTKQPIGNYLSKSGDTASNISFPNQTFYTPPPVSGSVEFDSSGRRYFRTALNKTYSFSTSKITANTSVIDSIPAYSGTILLNVDIVTSYQTIIASGSTAFTFANVPTNVNYYAVYVNGVRLTPTTDFTVSSNVITIPTAVTGDLIAFQEYR